MLEYIEKRDYIRMEVDCTARLNFQGIEPIEACLKDLSATGLLMLVKVPIPSGSVGNVSVAPGNNITPPLQVEVEIIRCDAVPGDPSMYALACSIREIQKVDAA